MAIRRIGQILVDLGFLTDEQLEMLLEEQQQRPGEMFGQIAIEHGADHRRAAGAGPGRADGHAGGQPGRDGRCRPTCWPRSPSRWPSSTASCPISFEDNTLTIAMCDPQKLSMIDELRSFLGYDIRAVVATEKDVLQGPGPLLCGRGRERRDADRRHGAGRRPGGGGRRRWRRTARWT